MSRNFTANNMRLEYGTPVVTGPPFTMACWFKSTSVAAAQTLMGVCNTANTNWHRLALFGNVAGDPVRAQTAGASTGNADSTAGYSADTWHHACGVWSATNSRTVYLDGANSATNTTSVTITVNNTRFASIDASTTQTMQGLIAEAGIWNVVLTAAEIQALAAGISPLLVRPASLVAYWPLHGVGSPEPEVIGLAEMTLSNAPTQGEHPRVLRPKLIVHPGAAAAAAAAVSPYYSSYYTRVVLGNAA